MFIADSPRFSLLNEAKFIADFWLFNIFFLEEFRCEERGEAPERDWLSAPELLLRLLFIMNNFIMSEETDAGRRQILKI